MDSVDHTIRLEIAPEPTDEELAAIVSSVMASQASTRLPAHQEQSSKCQSHWAREGRLLNMAPLERPKGNGQNLP